GLHQAGHHSDPSKIGDATCQRCVRGGRVRRPQTCLAIHPRTAGLCGISQIATGQHDDDELASPNTFVLAYSVLPARSAGLSHLHWPQALSFIEIRAIILCNELAFQMTSANSTSIASSFETHRFAMLLRACEAM